MTILSNKKVVVTGGAGFIGSNLCEYLLKYNNKVVCLDNLSTGKVSNIEHLQSSGNFEFILGDIRSLDICQKACKGADIVFHEAALGSVPRSVNDPISTNAVNISGSLNMLVAARDEGVKRFVFATSSSVYGDSETLPKVEEQIGQPLSPYALTKYVNESYARLFHDLYGMDYVGLRYFNVFGYRQDTESVYAAVIPIFVKSLMQLHSPVINGDGSYSRDFTFIDNVLQMNMLAATTENKSALNTIYNVACGDTTTLNDLAMYLKDILSRYNPEIANVEILHGANRKGDIPHSKASIAKAEKMLGYHPEYNVRQGLEKACEWYVKNL